MKYYSQSIIKTWRRCHKQFDYKYRQNLVRRQAAVALARGTTLHEMLDAQVMGKDWRVPLEDYRKDYLKMFDEEREKFPTPEELESIFLRYQAKYQGDGLNYEGRSEVVVSLEHNGLTFRGVADKLPRDSSDRVWLMDHKTHRVLPDEDARYSDIQTVLYYWAFRETGFHVDGVCWDYIRTKPPTVPDTLKSGGLTKRANIDTDYDTYLGEITKHGLNPEDYKDILDKVKGNVFFKRIFLPKPNEQLIQNVVSDFFDTAQEIENSSSCTRNLTKDCKMCSYYQLCSAEIRGLDSDFIKKQLFVVQEPA